jgi:hypothetical protein
MCRATDELLATPYATREHPREVVEGRVVAPVAYPHHADLLWHHEDSFNATWPGLLAFACERPAAAGGETTVADGRAVYRLLDPALRERFARSGIRYVRRYIPGFGLEWRTVFHTDDPAEVSRHCAAEGIDFSWEDGVLTTVATRPAITVDEAGEPVFFAQLLHWHERCLEPGVRDTLRDALDGNLPRQCLYGDGSVIDDATVDAVITAYREVDIPVSWRGGDLLLVNNRITAHARRAFEPPRAILAAFGEPTGFRELGPAG